MGFSPESYTFMTMGRLHRVDSQAKLGVVSGRWLVVSERAVFGLNFLLLGKVLENPPYRLPLAVSPFSLAYARQLPHRSWGSIAFAKGGLLERAKKREVYLLS